MNQKFLFIICANLLVIGCATINADFFKESELKNKDARNYLMKLHEQKIAITTDKLIQSNPGYYHDIIKKYYDKLLKKNCHTKKFGCIEPLLWGGSTLIFYSFSYFIYKTCLDGISLKLNADSLIIPTLIYTFLSIWSLTETASSIELYLARTASLKTKLEISQEIATQLEEAISQNEFIRKND